MLTRSKTIFSLSRKPLNTHSRVTRSNAILVEPKTFLTSYNITLPKTVKQVLTYKGWFKSMKDEYDVLMRKNTWELVLCPTNTKIIDKKWLFKIKELVGGSLEKLKSSLVAKVYLKVVGCDFVETFNSVVKHAAIRVILLIALSTHCVLI